MKRYVHSLHSTPGASQVTVVLPLNATTSVWASYDVFERDLPVIADNGDGAATQSDGDVKTGQVEPYEGGDCSGSGAGRWDYALATLVRGRRGNRRCGGGGGGRKVLGKMKSKLTRIT